MVHGKRMFVPPGTLGKSHAHTMKKPALPRPLGVKNNGTCGKPEDVTSKAPPEYGGSPKSPPSDALTLEGLTSEVPGSADSPKGPPTSEVSGSADSPKGPPSNALTPGSLQSATEEQAEIEGTLSLNSKKRRKNFKPRGLNKCKKLASLKEGQKLEVSFYHNVPVGKHHHLFTSYMGMLVRDRFIVPIRVHGWNDIDNAVKDHLWASISSKFKGKGFELSRHDTLCHMRKIWHTWRGSLVQKYVKPAETKERALAKGPAYMPQADWEWLVSEHFFDPKVLKVRERNSENRANLTMLHRTGCAPFRHIIYDKMGGREGNEPTIADIFVKTREKKGGLDEESASKLEEILDTAETNPGLTVFEQVEENFGPQDRGTVACFGYGLRPKHVRGELPSRRELQATIRIKDVESTSLRTRVGKLEEIVHMLLTKDQPQTNLANDANHVDNADDVDNAVDVEIVRAG